MTPDRIPHPALVFRIDGPEFEPVQSALHLAELIGGAASRVTVASMGARQRRKVLIEAESNDSVSVTMSIHHGGRAPELVSATIQSREGAVRQTLFFLIGSLPAPIALQEPEPNEMAGRVRLHTVSGSTYEIDFAAMAFRRLTAAARETDTDLPQPVALRRDGQLLKLLAVHQLAVGLPAVLDVEPLGNPRYVAYTRRTTTAVRLIERLAIDNTVAP